LKTKNFKSRVEEMILKEEKLNKKEEINKSYNKKKSVKEIIQKEEEELGKNFIFNDENINEEENNHFLNKISEKKINYSIILLYLHILNSSLILCLLSILFIYYLNNSYFKLYYLLVAQIKFVNFINNWYESFYNGFYIFLIQNENFLHQGISTEDLLELAQEELL